VVLADEPISSLDPSRAEDILFMLINIAKEEGKTLVASLHSVEYARKYFSRIIALREGKIYFDLPAEKVTDEDLKELYNLKEDNSLNIDKSDLNYSDKFKELKKDV